MRLSRSLAFGIGLAALALAAGLNAPAWAGSAKLRGEAMPAGFGRLSLVFDEPVQTRATVSNGVLIVGFSAPVQVDIARIARELPTYVSVARTDPDGRGLRFALTQGYKANLIEAGDKAFIDLLPESWKGLLPGPPPEAIAELTQRLRLAEVRARDAAARTRTTPPPLAVRRASLPTLERLVFEAPPGTALKAERTNNALKLVFDKPMTADAAALRGALPEGFRLTAIDNGKDALTVTLSMPEEWQQRDFSDETGLVLDLLKPAKSAPPPLVELPKPATAENKTGGAQTEPKAAEPKSAEAKLPTPGVAKESGAASNPPAPKVAKPEPPPGKAQIETADKRLDFRFPRQTGAAAFLDGGQLTLVFDTRDTIDPADLASRLPRAVAGSSVSKEGKVTLVRMRLEGQPLARFFADGENWTLDLGEDAGKPTATVDPQRSFDDRGQNALTVAMPGLTGVHWLDSGPGGLPMAVATAMGPARLTPKPYRFVEFELIPTLQGLAVQPRSDDVVARAGTEQVSIGRNGGLTLSLNVPGQDDPQTKAAGGAKLAPLIDAEAWTKLRLGAVRDTGRALAREAAGASKARKSETRMAVARFDLANGLSVEALGPLGRIMADDPAMRGNREALFLKALAAVQLHRDEEALTALDVPALKGDVEAGLWRALVQQRLGRDAQALVGFRQGEAILDRYPPDLQPELRESFARSALALQDAGIAERQIKLLGSLPPDEFDQERLALLQGMLEDLNGRADNAMNLYRPLFEAKSRPVAAEAQLRAVKLAEAEKRSDLKSEEAIARLETVAVAWRGGAVEIGALAELNRLYMANARWRDAFLVARRANETFPEDALTRSMHDATAQRFAELFADGGADKLPRIDALALFYDFKEFLPVGRRGDEITRLLADRLVELDLLDQAAEILRYQMEKRLTGAARSTVAARLAMIELMNGKPAEAVRALTTTRLVELPTDVKRARLLLESKGLSDLSRTDQALELLEGEQGVEVDRLRADINWVGRRWREAGESYERLLDESWRGAAPLSDSQRADVMRAAVSYVMAGETLSLDRLRTKFAQKMAQSADARTFAFVTGANRDRPSDIRELARAAANADAISEFMKAYRERYPNYSSPVRQPAPAKPPAQGAAAEGAKPEPAPQQKG